MRITSSSVNGMSTNNLWRQKCVIFTLNYNSKQTWVIK